MADWKVYFRGGLWGHHNRDHAGKEIKAEKSFIWGDDIWYIPSLYVCGAGIVIDYCVAIKPEKIKSFMEKWELLSDDDSMFDEETREALENDNPMHVDFSTMIEINNKTLRQTHRTGTAWIPKDIVPENMARAKGDDVSEQMMSYYHLDRKMAWVMQRVSYPWATKRKTQMRKLTLTMMQNPVSIFGMYLENPKEGDCISFVHPITGESYDLTVKAYTDESLEQRHFADENMEWPTHYKVMNFTVEPELPKHKFAVRDCAQSDQPRMKQDKCGHGKSAYGVSVIGGSNGPTSIFIAGEAPKQMHAAISSVHFSKVEDIKWRMVFYEKMKADVRVEIVLG